MPTDLVTSGVGYVVHVWHGRKRSLVVNGDGTPLLYGTKAAACESLRLQTQIQGADAADVEMVRYAVERHGEQDL